MKPIEETSQEEVNAYLYVSMHLRGLQLQKFDYEIRTSDGHNVRFRRSAPLSITFAQMPRSCASRLNACLSAVVPRTLGLALVLPGKRYGVEEEIGTSAETTTMATKAGLKNCISVF